MILNTALKVLFASALVLGPARAGAPGANGGVRKDVRGGNQGDATDVHSMIRKLQEEVSQLKARLLNAAGTESPVGPDVIGANDDHGSLDLCETADLLHGINARTGKADLTDHTHDINLLHNHDTSQTDHDHPIDVDHAHNLTLPKIKCTCEYDYDEKETTEIQTETWVGPTETGGGQADITAFGNAILPTQTTGPANEDLTHLHDLTDLLTGLDDAGKELSYAADSFGSDECPEPTLDFPARYPTCTNPGTCNNGTLAEFPPCNDGGNCGSAGVCFTSVFCDGICQRSTPCAILAACPNGQSDCESDEVCTLDTCCANAPVGPDVCVPLSRFCNAAGVVEMDDEDLNDGDLTTSGIYRAPERH